MEVFMFRLFMVLLLLFSTLGAGVPEILILPNSGAWVTLEEEPTEIQEKLYLPTYGMNVRPGTVWKSAKPEGLLRFSYPRFGLFELEEGTDIHLVLKESLDIRGRFLKFRDNTLYVGKDDGILLIDPSNILYYELPKLPADKTLEYFPPPLSSKKRIVPVHYGFQTGDFSWSAEYELRWTSDEKAVFSPWFRLTNRGSGTLMNAKVTLLAGDVKTGQVMQEDMMRAPKGMGMNYVANAASSAEAPQSSGDNYIFKLKNFVTFLPRTDFREALAEPVELTPEKVYIVTGNSFSSSGSIPRHADLELTLKLKKAGKDNPILPEGTLRIFDEKGVFAGEVPIPNTPAGETLTVSPGKSFDLVYERTILDYQRERETAEGRIRYEIRNQSDKTLPVILRDRWHGNWTVKNTSHKTEKKSATELEIPLTLKGGESVTVEYTCYVSYR
ncbi:MAG: hypothetical protein XD77_0763 [Marinimicrobia bacterium 46_47]|nr:MAG: hypothetical protein XD77_0763 [Marinimicrobia bacterium 46_47]